MTKYLVMIDTDNPADVQVFTPQDGLAHNALIPDSPQAHALAPHVSALKERNRLVMGTSTRTRKVAKAKVPRAKAAAAPAGDEDGTWVNVKETARQLGVAESTVFYKIKHNGLVARKNGLRTEVTQASIDTLKNA